MRAPRQLSDKLFEEFFTLLPCNRDRAIIATAVSSGARAGEMLSMRPIDLNVDELTISVIPKGGRHRAPVRTAPDAFMWITLAPAETPAAPQAPLWQTRTQVPRPLTYWALRAVLERANTTLRSNITFHDLRHTYCHRLLENPELLITEVQELMRHKQLASTEIYMRARMDDLVVKLVAHYARPPAPPPAPAAGYDQADMNILFPRTFDLRMSPQIVSRAQARAQDMARTMPETSTPLVPSTDTATAQPHFDRPVDAAERDRVCATAVELVRRWLPESRGRATERGDSERAVKPFMAFLDQFPGDSYQDRWMTSGCDTMGHDWVPAYASTNLRRLGARQALNALLLLGVIRPSMDWLMASKQTRFWRDWTVHHDPKLWDRFFEVTTREGCTDRLAWTGAQSLIRVCIHHGIGLQDITGQHLLAFRDTALKTDRASRTLYGVWHHAKLAGLLQDEPDSLTALVNMGQRTPTQLVDRYNVTDPGIRQLLIDYVTELSANNDYSSVDKTSRVLVNLFWRDIQDHHPGQATIALTAEQATSWKERIKTRPDGAPRQHTYSVLGTVRTFYLDVAAWALDDPARWAQWAVSPPITARDVRGYGIQRRQVTAKMQDRTRTLAPHLPRLAAAARSRHREAAQLLSKARAAQPGETFTVAGRPYTRLQLSPGANPAAVRVSSPQREQRVDPVLVEGQRFWTWAAIEVLRHSGIRIEEMLELTHLSIRQYRKPDGQVIPLLQVAPSKSDQERILPASPELTAVLARIVTRLTDGGTAIPLAIRRNERDLTNSPPTPLLFQLRDVGRSRGITYGSIRTWLADLANTMQLRDVDGQLLRFTPHDLRRLFITDLVNSGLPIHLAAKIVGHTSIETTRGYTAVYQKDVFEAYDKFIADRRTLRPSAEYREPTEAEWTEFNDHFMRRKISLGDCRRPYGSGCTHEHACIRCQFLQVDPAQGGQLDTIGINPHARVDEARANSWLGDVDQLLVTLEHLEHKKADIQTMLNTLPTPLITATEAVPVTTSRQT